MSYAEVTAKNAKQTPEEAAAPQPPQIASSETASSSSLVDVDSPSVRVVPSDFKEQSVKTDTQAQRLEREAKAAAEKARAEAELARKKTAAKARQADSWVTNKLANMSDEEGSALLVANLLAVVGVSVWVGYKAFGLYERGRLGWQQIGIGAAILGAVGAVEAVFGGYWYKAKGKKQ